MKIAITGHSAGIGQALTRIFEGQGYEVIGLSRRNGYNIRSLPKVAAMIEPCDIFVNNAQAGFAQTELLFEMWQRWQGQKKHIMVISTMLTLSPTAIKPDIGIDQYRIQKLALEESCKQLSYKSPWPLITIVKPGGVATQPDYDISTHADVNQWAETLVKCLDLANPNLRIYEISLGMNYFES